MESCGDVCACVRTVRLADLELRNACQVMVLHQKIVVFPIESRCKITILNIRTVVGAELPPQRCKINENARPGLSGVSWENRVVVRIAGVLAHHLRVIRRAHGARGPVTPQAID